MLEVVSRLLVALSVAIGAHGVVTAAAHANPGGNTHSVAAIEAAIARRDAVTTTQPAANKPSTPGAVTGLDRANEVANEHAADGLAKAAAAGAEGRAKAAAARSAHQPAAGASGDQPAFDTPPTSGPPATHPPVPAPPVDAPGLGNRP